jgi:L-fuconolactonase
MRVVDSHCHASPYWFEPVETLLGEMDRNQIDAAVLTQILGQADNTYQQDCLRRYPGRFASVVLVDPTEPQAIEQLRRLVDEGASGLRLRPTSRSSGHDPLAIWRAAADLDIAISCSGSSAEFASSAFAEVIESLPGGRVVLEHLGARSRPDVDAAEQAQRQAVFDLARYPSVYIKVHGLGEIARRAMPPRPFPFELPLPDYLQQALRAFGAERMMWGSNFPPVAAQEGYANALRLCRDQFAESSPEARELIFGRVAEQVFRIR